jgi:DNA mismatch endonuclease (patch repair protein)
MKREGLTTEGVDPARSAQMARIRGADTKPELRVRRALHKLGLRYRLHDRRLPGKPDLTFPSRRIALFVHGCFWHRHPDPSCNLTRTPKSRLEFWESKFFENVERDVRKRRELTALGWRVITIWECETRSAERLAEVGTAIRDAPIIPTR